MLISDTTCAFTFKFSGTNRQHYVPWNRVTGQFYSRKRRKKVLRISLSFIFHSKIAPWQRIAVKATNNLLRDMYCVYDTVSSVYEKDLLVEIADVPNKDLHIRNRPLELSCFPFNAVLLCKNKATLFLKVSRIYVSASKGTVYHESAGHIWLNNAKGSERIDDVYVPWGIHTEGRLGTLFVEYISNATIDSISKQDCEKGTVRYMSTFRLLKA